MSKPSVQPAAERLRRRTTKVDAPATPDAADSPADAADSPAGINPQERRDQIARLAYFRAQRRGFQPGFELEDWVSAEQEVDRALLQASGSTQS